MNDVRNDEEARSLLKLGALALVVQLVVFQNSIGMVPNPGVSGLLEDVLSGGLLFVSVVCFAGWLYLRFHGRSRLQDSSFELGERK